MTNLLSKIMKPERYRGVNIHPVANGFKVLGSELPTLYLAKKKVDLVYENFKKAVATLSNAH